MGWRRREGSKWEDDVKYDERVAGICTFWAVITRLPAPPQQQIGLNKFFQIESSWTFVARIANTPLDLLSNAHFVCLSNWWEACASNILATYKKQGYKLLQVISVTLTKKVIEKKYPGAARLLILGEEFFQKGDIETIKEMER